MKRFFFIHLLLSAYVHADTVDHYMNIANNIPQMEMKADPQSQAWARSARNILSLTCECIAETLSLINAQTASLGQPLFCPPSANPLDAKMMNDLIQQTYREFSSNANDKNKMTVSEIALFGIRKKYPCQNNTINANVSEPSKNKQIIKTPPVGIEHQSTLMTLQ